MKKIFDFPNWAALTPAFAAAELPRLLEKSEAAVAAIEAGNATSYEGIVTALDDATRELWRLWGAVGHETSVCNSDAWRKVEEDAQPAVVAFSLRVGQSRELYAKMKALSGTLSGVRARIVAKSVQAAELAGVGLTGERRERFNALQTRLAALAMDFHNAVIDATKAFAYEKGGKRYTIDDANFPETMKHCADREVREKLYRARSVRAPENEARIAEILKLRGECAQLLGYPNYAAQSLAAKCAPSADAVLKMIDALDAATVQPAADEDAVLREEAARLGLATLEPWDRAFVAERLRERQYAYSDEELKKHFELEDVLVGLFRLAKTLFGVDVREVAATEKPSVWHRDVRFFAVEENGERIAHFYFDPFVRNGEKSGGAWMNEFRNRRVTAGGDVVLPLAVLVTNFPTPDEKGRVLLPFREVETVFHEFGHALQCMLTRVDEEDAAGINLVEWDAVEVASQFMENWCLDDRTGITVPADLKAKVRAAKNFRAASVCRRQLAFAKTDLELHLAPCADADAVKRANFAHFGLVALPEDKFLCAFTHIFAGGYAAGYYGYKWSEVMSADCYGAFEESGIRDEAAVAALGRRYRETILALGGSQSALDVFRQFRGRDPEIAALLSQQGLV